MVTLSLPLSALWAASAVDAPVPVKTRRMIKETIAIGMRGRKEDDINNTVTTGQTCSPTHLLAKEESGKAGTSIMLSKLHSSIASGSNDEEKRLTKWVTTMLYLDESRWSASGKLLIQNPQSTQHFVLVYAIVRFEFVLHTSVEYLWIHTSCGVIEIKIHSLVKT